MENPVYEDEVVESLDYDGMNVIQKKNGFKFGTDSVLLADFATIRKGDRIVDLGTGSGILCFLMASRHPDTTYVGIEIQQDIADMASRSVSMNEMSDRISIDWMDMKNARDKYGCNSFDAAVCNPPYGKSGGTLLNQSETKQIARHETDCSIDDMLLTASGLVRSKGRLSVVFPALRAFEMMYSMHQHHFEPKRIQTVQTVSGKEPKLVLIEAIKDGGSMLQWLPPLVLKDENGNVTDEYKRIYRM